MKTLALLPFLLAAAAEPRDKCKGGTLSATSADGAWQVELSEDRSKATFLKKRAHGVFEATGAVDLSDDIRGCGRLLVTPDGLAFFFVRTQGREESDDRRFMFVRRDPAGGKPIYKKWSLKDLGIDPRTLSRSESHTQLPKVQMVSGGDLLVGFMSASAKDGTLTALDQGK